MAEIASLSTGIDRFVTPGGTVIERHTSSDNTGIAHHIGSYMKRGVSVGPDTWLFSGHRQKDTAEAVYSLVTKKITEDPQLEKDFGAVTLTAWADEAQTVPTTVLVVCGKRANMPDDFLSDGTNRIMSAVNTTLTALESPIQIPISTSTA